MYAETIIAAIGAQCMIWETSPAAAELEERMMEWVQHAMGLPDIFDGVIQDSASAGTLAAIISAREVCTNFSSNIEGVPNNLRVYCSKETHSSIEKAVGIAGIGKKNLVKIQVDDQLRIIPAALKEQIEEDLKRGYQPCCVVATMGTTGTVAVDPINPIADICKQYKIWLHIDAAYAGIALFLPEYRWMAEGIENADSIVIDAHKWMFTNFDCSLYYIKDSQVLIKTFEILPEYLKTKTRGLVNDYRDWSIPLGRRFRALKLWFVVRSYGIKGLQAKIRKHIKLNQYFANEIIKNKQLELVLEPFLNFSCFCIRRGLTMSQIENNVLNEQLLEKLNDTGELYLTHTKFNDRYVLRVVIGQTYVEEKNVDNMLKVINQQVHQLLNKS